MTSDEIHKLRVQLENAIEVWDEAEILRLRGLMQGIKAKKTKKLDRRWAEKFEQLKGVCPSGYAKCQYCGKVFPLESIRSHEGACSDNPDAGSRMGKRKRLRTSEVMNPYSGKGVDYGTSRVATGSYIVQDGLVVFLQGDSDTRDGRIARSGSDSEDYWKGFGVGHPDNGRFGGINGEDYAD